MPRGSAGAGPGAHVDAHVSHAGDELAVEHVHELVLLRVGVKGRLVAGRHGVDDRAVVPAGSGTVDLELGA